MNIISAKIYLFVLIIFLAISCSTAQAQGLIKKRLKSKEEVISDTLTTTLEKGITFYPCSTANSNIIIAGEFNFSTIEKETIFINTLLYAIDKAERGKEHFVHVDFDKKEFSEIIEVQSLFYNENSTYYKYANTFKVTDNTLSFLASEMFVCYKNLMGTPKEYAFENLSPQKKAKHKNYINELAAKNSIYLNDLISFIQKNKPEPITHWNEIKAGTIVKGMNTTECLLSVGKPMHKRNNGDQIKWMVNNDFVVIFKNGLVINTIQ